MGLPGTSVLAAAATYAGIAGYRPADLGFYIAYAALAHAIDVMRTPLRATAFQALTEALEHDPTGEWNDGARSAAGRVHE